MEPRTLQDVKVGDLVGPVRAGYFGHKNTWTGVLHQVTKVTAKRFYCGGSWKDKATGREPGRGGSYSYILATPEMIAEHTAKANAQKDKEAKTNAFHERPDYADASAIAWRLSQMNPEDHPLDRLTPAEWAELRRRLTA
jgi:hypothetical protein